MKKIILSVVIACLTYAAHSQSDYLYITGPWSVGIDAGYSHKGYIPFGFHLGYNKLQFGLTFGMNTVDRPRGEHYSNINWNEYPGDEVSQGSYHTPITFDVGYNVYGGFVIGGGVGYAIETLYKNMFDEFHILGRNGSYHITANGDGKPEVRGFVSYYFPTDKMPSIFLKAHYSITMGIGISLGVTI